MAYRVVYGNQDPYSAAPGMRIGRTIFMTVAVTTLTCLLTLQFWPAGAQVLDKLTAFRGIRVMRQHLDILALGIRSGIGVRQAVTAFCRDVIQMGLTYAA